MGWILLAGVEACILVACALLGVRQIKRTTKDLRERLAHGERIEADEQGITLWRDGEPRQIAWGALEKKDLRFTTFLSNYPLLQSMIALYAPQLALPQQQVRLHDALESTEWENGVRTFHYRTRSNRSGLGVLWLVPLLCLVTMIGIMVMWLRYGLKLPELVHFPELKVIVGLALAAVFAWAFLLWRYKRARLLLDRESLTNYSLFGQRRVFFEEMAALGRDELSYYIELPNGQRPIRWGANLAGNAELLAELERRAGLKEAGATRPALYTVLP